MTQTPETKSAKCSDCGNTLFFEKTPGNFVCGECDVNKKSADEIAAEEYVRKHWDSRRGEITPLMLAEDVALFLAGLAHRDKQIRLAEFKRDLQSDFVKNYAAENDRLKEQIRELVGALEFYAHGYDPEKIAAIDAEEIPEPVKMYTLTQLDNLGKADGPFGVFDAPKRKFRAGKIARQALARHRGEGK
jgi:rubredoxin